ncbi:MAG: tRNA (adenosine(37)-N6)-threonylcarbamoyltransferase complex dimerization subunit type 1 TsaB [Candidatus Syntrophonatronum acetioxidans]|uniref:tRNA (Adenosine(37)-N6)-threonylcarbamoyltransferase complex dimerization subunit type 1 TsaB n=1 Tax=Candidatus Syntrophonatronum acetioxidans TaxID=1795816 RepID=A0A424YA89_9FIRM|nr:MAG: tRNA (adenosine(37)-N6)-threonylcarbamoyltransferase complex dimerization subunit type 1 TsaB [Candidatus Syntrophonatronum acetioxidans]
MLVLGIDTATLVCSVALADYDRIIGEYSLNIKKTHSQRLMPLIDNLMRDSHLDREALEGIAVTSGPGSFTGIRIGVATARGLAQGLRLPLVGVPTLDILAAQFPYARGIICPLLDARRQEVYACLYQFSGDKMERLTSYMAAPLVEILDLLKEKPGERVIFLGDALERYGDIIKERLGERASWAPPPLRINRGALVAQLGREKIVEGEKDYLESYKNLEPLYLRRSQAEVKWEERQKRG